MTGKLLLRGMLVGVLAGLLVFAFARLFGEPQVDQAILFEDHVRQAAHEAAEPELVSRAVQSTLGLLTGVVVYGAALGGLFALAFAYAYGRIGRLSPRAVAALLAGAGFVVLVLAPQLKYPANPPSVGRPETIQVRTVLYFGMLLLSAASGVFAVLLARTASRRLGSWNGALAGLAAYVLAMAAAMLVLHPVDEVPAGFPADVLWRFRLAALGMQAVLWSALGLGFGALAERLLAPNRSIRAGGPWGGARRAAS